MSFYDIHNQYPWQEVTTSILEKTDADVMRALHATKRDLEDFKALVSPAATPHLEEMAAESLRITQKRFGKTIQLYLPLYLSNECSNSCAYCGFNHENKIDRMTLDLDQVMEEIAVIKEMGYQHILLVSGEHPKRCGFDYLEKAIDAIKPHFSQISIEVAPMEQHEYEALSAKGLHSVYIYQETYHKEHYPLYHPKGKKSDFKYRIETPDRIGKSGVHKIGVGCLLGLEDWRTEAFFTTLHLKYLEKRYWKTRYSISLPRLRAHAGSFVPNFEITDKEVLQLICAYRMCNEEVEISLSTRESRVFRNNVMKLGVTSMSAGSKTEPGGYAKENHSLEQFSINDDRSVEEIAEMIRFNEYEPVWKDWDCFMQ